jgi:hypothetical protein
MAESIFGDEIADAELNRLGQNFEDPESYIASLSKLVTAYNNIAKTTGQTFNQAVVAANKTYATQLNARAKLSGQLTKYLTDLNGADSRLQAAALNALVKDATSIRKQLSEIEKQESINTHPWYEMARAKAIQTQGQPTGSDFWGELMNTVTTTGTISDKNFNIPWLVQNLNVKIESGEIGDWRNLPGISSETRRQLEQMWAAADSAMKSRQITSESLESISRGVTGSGESLVGASGDKLRTLAAQISPTIQSANSFIVGDKQPADIAADAQNYMNQNLNQYNANVQEAVHDMIIDMLAYNKSSTERAGFPEFSMDADATWKGHALSEPTFRAWAAENGFESLGAPIVDSSGKIVGVTPGADDTRALRAFGKALYHYGNPERSGYGKQNVIIPGDLGTRGVRYGTAVDADGKQTPIVEITEGGEAKIFQGVASQSAEGKIDFIPARLSEFDGRTISYDTDTPAKYEEMQSGNAAEAARKFYNEFKLPGQAATQTAAKDVQTPVEIPLAGMTVIPGTASQGSEPRSAFQVVDNQAKTILNLLQTDAGLVAVPVMDDFKPIVRGGVPVALKLDPTFLDARGIDSVEKLGKALTESTDAAVPDLKQIFVSEAKYGARKAEFETAKRAERTAKNAAPAWKPVDASVLPSQSQAGINYGIDPRTGMYRVKTESGEFIQVAPGVVKSLEKPSNPDDEKSIRDTMRESRQARQLKAAAETMPEAAEILARRDAAVPNLDMPPTRAERRKEAAETASGERFDAPPEVIDAASEVRLEKAREKGPAEFQDAPNENQVDEYEWISNALKTGSFKDAAGKTMPLNDSLRTALQNTLVQLEEERGLTPIPQSKLPAPPTVNPSQIPADQKQETEKILRNMTQEEFTEGMKQRNPKLTLPLDEQRDLNRDTEIEQDATAREQSTKTKARTELPPQASTSTPADSKQPPMPAPPAAAPDSSTPPTRPPTVIHHFLRDRVKNALKTLQKKENRVETPVSATGSPGNQPK